LLYHQPYGISDTNASYINGNPSTGTMGSIPPAASIEYPQREIVNLITDATMVPTDGDLHQLSKAIQSGKLIYADDTGSVNLLALNCVPSLAALKRGMIFITMAATTNNGPSNATVNGLTAPIVHPKDNSPLLPFDINTGQMLALAFDGTNFQLAWSGSGSKAAQGVLQANYDFYVNGTTGSDTLYDGTQATVGSAGHGPFKTIQTGINAASKLNANGFTITIHVADGTYPSFASVTNVTNGGLVLKGNSATPAACLISTPAAGATACIGARGVGVGIFIDGFKLTNAWPNGYDMTSQQGSNINFQNMDFGYCQGAHMLCDLGSMSAYGNYTISGNANAHLMCQYSDFVLTPSGYNTVTIGGGVALNYFMYATGIGFVRCNTRTNFVGALTQGYKFYVNANAVIDTGGAGVNYFPGPTAGVQATGGQYL
jgi:hypothetical protein